MNRQTFRVNGPRGLSFLRKLGKSVWKSYISNRINSESIHNDLGASFTQLKRDGERIIKRAEKKGEEKLRNEIKWTLRLQSTRFGKRYLPKIYRYSLEPGNVYYEMKYYSFPNLRKIIFEDMNTTYFLKLRWEKLLKILFKELYRERNSSPTPDDFFIRTHVDKYKDRMAETIQAEPLYKELLEKPLYIINGKEFLQPGTIIRAIEADADITKRLTPGRLYLSHGDLHCNNILCGFTVRQFIFLDSRGKSPYGSIYYDPAYDLAKIYHDLHSYYSLIEKGLFQVYLKEREDIPLFEYYFTDRTLVERFDRNYFYVRTFVEKRYDHFQDLHYRTDFNEAMLYLTMLPMHMKNRDEGLICFITGVVRLNQWLRKHHPEIRQKLFDQNLPDPTGETP